MSNRATKKIVRKLRSHPFRSYALLILIGSAAMPVSMAFRAWMANPVVVSGLVLFVGMIVMMFSFFPLLFMQATLMQFCKQGRVRNKQIEVYLRQYCLAFGLHVALLVLSLIGLNRFGSDIHLYIKDAPSGMRAMMNEYFGWISFGVAVSCLLAVGTDVLGLVLDCDSRSVMKRINQEQEETRLTAIDTNE